MLFRTFAVHVTLGLMVPVLLLVLSGLFAFLAFDAWRLAVPAKDVPYEVTARPLGLEVDGVPTVELERRKEWNIQYGQGDLSCTYWLWLIACVGCLGGAV